MKKLLLLLLTGVLVFPVGGCAPEEEAPIGMAVEFMDHAACAYIAQDMGWYEEEGLELTAWEDDPAFDLDQHLLRISQAAAADEEGLRAVASELMSRQLDLSKPLWQFHLIEPYGSGCALLGRVHH